jgi:hypothetical protein
LEDIMIKNMGTVDRVVRTASAFVIGILILNGTISGTLGDILGIFALIFLVTSAIGFCPLYLPFKFSTRGQELTSKG